MIFGAVKKLAKAVAKTSGFFRSNLEKLFGVGKVGPELLENVEGLLISSDVGAAFTSEVIEDLESRTRKQTIRTVEDAVRAIKKKFTELLGGISSELNTAVAPDSNPTNLMNSLTVYLFVGVNGTGKTTSIGKFAYRLKNSENKRVMIAACDTFRAAAIEQLEIWGERAGAEVLSQKRGADPAAVCYDALDKAVSKNYDYLLIDTAGRLQTKADLMRELGKLSAVVAKKVPGAPHEVLLTIDATTGQNAVNQVREFNSFCKLSGIVLTKLDGTAKGGIIFAIAKEFGLPVKLVGTGESVDDIDIFSPEIFVNSLFQS